MSNSLKLSTSIGHTLSLHNGKTSQPLLAGQHNTVKTKAGEHYRILKSLAGEEQLLDDVIAKKSGEDLQLQYSDGTQVTLEDYYGECQAASACEVTLPGQDAGGYKIDANSSSGTVLGDGSTLVYGHGDSHALLDMAQGNHTLSATLSGLRGEEITYVPASPAAPAAVPAASSDTEGMNMMAITGGGLGLAAVGGGGGGGGGVASAVSAANNILSTTVVAGPVVAGNGLTVNIYGADGTTLLASGTISSTGTCSIDVGSYTGVVIAKVIDSNGGNDFMDEATGTAHDLNADLMAIGIASSGTVNLNINALTTVAAMKAGAVFSGASTATITTDTVIQNNAAVAQAFGLSDLTGTAIVATIDTAGGANAAYTPGALNNAGKYGAILAALSGADAVNGGNMQATIDNLATGLTVSGSTGSLSPATADMIIQGAITASASTSGSGSTGLTAVISNQIAQTSASVSIDTITTDNIINASEQGFTITGTNASDATVNLSVGGITRATTAIDSTHWSYTLTGADIAAMGQGGEMITAIATLTDGGTASATRSFVVDTVVLAPSVPDLSSGSDSGSSNTDNLTNVTTPTFTGTAEAGATVTLLEGATVLGTATANGTGAWSITSSTLAQGAHNISAKQTDVAGNVSAASSALDITIDTAAPTAIAAVGTVTDNVGIIIGALTTGGVTDDTSLTLAGTITGTLGTDEVVAVYDGATRLGIATVSSNGSSSATSNTTTSGTSSVSVYGQVEVSFDGILNTTWSYTDSTLANGDAVSYTVRVEDAAGNQGASSAAFITTIDTTAPTATAAIGTVTDNYGINTGALTTGGMTDDTSLDLAGTITGTLGAGEVVAIYDGATRLGNATVSGSSWSYTDSTLANGDAVSYTVRVEDAAGNQGASSAAFITTIDTTAPTATATIVTVTDNYGINTGVLTTGGMTDDTSLDIAGTITGTLGAGEVVAVYDGATRLGNATVSGNNWSYTDSTLAYGDAVSYTVRVEDAAGNQGAASTAFTVTISAPTATAAISTVTDNVGTITGTLTTGGVTDDTSLALAGTITGTLGEGEVVAVYDGATRLGNATVNGSNWSYTDSTLANGDTVSYTAVIENAVGDQGTASTAFTTTIDTEVPAVALTAATDNVGTVQGPLNSGNTTDDTALVLSGTNEAGATINVYNGATLLGAATVTGTTWSYTATVADGVTYQFNAKATDAAGNTSDATANFTVTGDTVALAPSVPDLAPGSDSGSSYTDNLTNVTTPTFTGTAEAWATVTLLEGTTVLGTALAYGSGTWSITSSVVLAEGTHSISAKQTDAAGNVSEASSALDITIDTTAPVVLGASFSETSNAGISITFGEAVTALGTSGLSILNGLISPTAVTPSGISGIGSTTLTISTSSTLSSTDIVHLRYSAGSNNVTDLAGNSLTSGSIFIGGSGASNIDLSGWGFSNPVALFGNSGSDTLTGTKAADYFVDGEGADTIFGRRGADHIQLSENGIDKAYASDTIKIAPGDSPAYSITSIDTITGFDAKSATAANHDILDLQSKVIAGNATNVNGMDVGLLATHSISSGIVSFKNTGGSAILVDMNNVNDVVTYLAININSPGATMAFEMDTDNNGTVDSLAVFQDNGTAPLADNPVLPDTIVVLEGVTGVTLGTTAGANVVQIQDTQGPYPTGWALTSDGFAANFAENTFATTNLAFTVQKNGAGTVYAPTSVDGSGTTSLAVHYSGLSLAQTDWLLCTTAATNVSDGFSDGVNTYWAGKVSVLAMGGSGDNTIDLSALTSVYEINGHGGNDTIIGSSGHDMILGGSGADTLTGGEGTDYFYFNQGDSPVVAVNLNANNMLDNGDTFTFAGGVADRITDFSSAEMILLNGFVNDDEGRSPVNTMAVTPTNGLATDQGFFLVQGGYNAGTGVFTANNAGADTLVVYDGDSTAAVTQAGIVLSNVTLAQLHTMTNFHAIGYL